MITSGKTVDNFLVYTIQPCNTCWWWEVMHTHPKLQLLVGGLLKDTLKAFNSFKNKQKCV